VAAVELCVLCNHEMGVLFEAVSISKFSLVPGSLPADQDRQPYVYQATSSYEVSKLDRVEGKRREP
jgi:hypothetical protein